MIQRNLYLKQIKQFIDKDIIKVITGFRRSGKSVLLRQIMNEIPSANKIYMNFEDKLNRAYLDEERLNAFLEEKIQGFSGKVYLFLDEIQDVENFEIVINSLRVRHELDIYLTGSNSKMLAGELATHLAGRYVTFELFPFSYQEFRRLTPNATFAAYIVDGGLPMVSDLAPDEQGKKMLISDIYNSVVLKDIVARNKIRDAELLDKIISYAISQIGHVFSAHSISKYFKSENRTVAPMTIMNYLKACEEAYLLKPVRFEDANGKKLLNVNNKYYVIDQGIRQALFSDNIENIELILENIVYYELLRRGFEVTVGRNGNKEIDFVARKAGRIEYYQVTYVLGGKETRDREFGAYRGLDDNFPKYVLSTDTLDFSQGGIIHRNIEEWLLEES